jgi:hypothetical protein
MTALATPQRLRALDAANAVRLECARIKEGVRQMKRWEALRHVAALVEAVPDGPGDERGREWRGRGTVATMRAWDLLIAIPSLGDHKVSALLSQPNLRIAPRRRLGEMTDRQRRLLAVELRLLARRWEMGR